MTKEQFEMITNIIDSDIKSGNIEDLKKLKDLIENNLGKNDSQLFVEENKEILLQGLLDFITDNLSSETKGKVRKLSIIEAVIKYRCLVVGKVKVYHLLGVPKGYLLNQRGCGINSIEILEDMLNKYGLSLSLELNNEQRNQLDTMNEKTKKLF